MWKNRDEASGVSPDPQPDRPARAESAARASERAAIGRSITIRGDVSGDEDLLIQGSVEGSVNLQQHAVTIGPDGDVQASITARVVTVEGSVRGDITADEQIILRSSAQVEGDLKSPRVVLENGARFRGGVDMGEGEDRTRRGGGMAGAGRPGESGQPRSTSASVSTPTGGSVPKPEGAKDGAAEVRG